MSSDTSRSLIDCFSDLKDPRVDRTKRHLLTDIIMISICAVICGAEGWEDIEEFAEARQEWFECFLALPNGIPSHDTISRVFARLDPREFEKRFREWVEGLREKLSEVISVDGKVSRGSHDRAAGKKPISMVSAWAHDNSLVLGQLKVEDKTNEIRAIPELLQMLDLKGCIVTTDAMGCQKEIASKIISKEADYVLAVKDNQETLHSEIAEYFDWAVKDKFNQTEYSRHQTTDGGHGRIEVRRCYSSSDLRWFADKDKWVGLQSIAMVESEREVLGREKTLERRYYISSLASDAVKIGRVIREHWGVENSLHWVLDMSFREDQSRIRKDNAPENMAILRHIALSLLKQEKTNKRGIRAKRLKAGWEDSYLLKILTT